jgi:hypothetical protein
VPAIEKPLVHLRSIEAVVSAASLACAAGRQVCRRRVKPSSEKSYQQKHGKPGGARDRDVKALAENVT